VGGVDAGAAFFSKPSSQINSYQWNFTDVSTTGCTGWGNTMLMVTENVINGPSLNIVRVNSTLNHTPNWAQLSLFAHQTLLTFGAVLSQIAVITIVLRYSMSLPLIRFVVLFSIPISVGIFQMAFEECSLLKGI
jgi:hypothetical protein